MRKRRLHDAHGGTLGVQQEESTWGYFSRAQEEESQVSGVSLMNVFRPLAKLGEAERFL